MEHSTKSIHSMRQRLLPQFKKQKKIKLKTYMKIAPTNICQKKIGSLVSVWHKKWERILLCIWIWNLYTFANKNNTFSQKFCARWIYNWWLRWYNKFWNMFWVTITIRIQPTGNNLNSTLNVHSKKNPTFRNRNFFQRKRKKSIYLRVYAYSSKVHDEVVIVSW